MQLAVSVPRCLYAIECDLALRAGRRNKIATMIYALVAGVPGHPPQCVRTRSQVPAGRLVRAGGRGAQSRAPELCAIARGCACCWPLTPLRPLLNPAASPHFAAYDGLSASLVRGCQTAAAVAYVEGLPASRPAPCTASCSPARDALTLLPLLLLPQARLPSRRMRRSRSARSAPLLLWR